jgi:tetratricopeptide (TPR) repeat protein
VYDELIARDGERDELALREQVANALVNKGFRLGVLGRSDEEIEVYDELIARDGERDELALREQVANALVNKGVRLGVLGRSDDAIEVYDELIAHYGDAPEPALRNSVANALGNSAKLRLERREYAVAIDVIRSAFEHADDGSDPLRAELWMYLFALGPHDQRANACAELVRLLQAGVRSPGWDFSLIVAHAIEQGHDDSDRLVALADVISTHEDIHILDGWIGETDQ